MPPTVPYRPQGYLLTRWTLLSLLVCMVQLLCVPGSGEQSMMALKQARADAPIVSQIRIRILPKADQPLYESLARDLLPLKPGAPYTLEAVKESITALKDSRLFGTIHLPDPVINETGAILTLELTPFRRIKEIRIQNAFPLYEREVLNLMQMTVGGPYQPDTLEDQAGRIRQLFRQQGFPRAEVRISGKKDPKDGHMVVGVTVEKGPYQRIQKLLFQGNASVSSLRLKLACKTWRATLLFGAARRFVAKEMAADVKELTALYRKKGFAEVKIKATVRSLENETDREAEAVDLLFSIREGPRYDVRFTGNQSLSSRRLKGELVLDKEGNLNNFGLKKSLRNIRQTYAAKGFAQADIGLVPSGPEKPDQTEKLKKEPRKKAVNIRIHEGPRDRVASLDVIGNRSLPDKAVEDNILTPEAGGIFDPKVLQADAEAIRALYLQQGFAQVRVETNISHDTDETESTRRVRVILAITEGPRTRVEAIRFSGLSAFSRDKALSLLKLAPGAWYDASLADQGRTRLVQALAEAGYPHVQVSDKTLFSRDNTRLSIEYDVDQGPRVRVGQLFYTGNLRTGQKILAREMEISPGDLFSLSNIVTSRRNLLNIGALDAARIRSVGLKSREEEEVDLIVEVSEKKPYFLEVGAGYDTERHLYTTAATGDRNLAGRDLNLQSGAELSQIGYKLEASLTDPRFLDTRFLSHTRMFTEQREEFNKEFGNRSHGLSQDFLRVFQEYNLTLSAGLVYEFRDQYLTITQDQARDLTQEEADTYQTRHIMSLSPGITYRTTDSYIRPRKGILAAANIDLSKGIDTDLDDFIKFQGDLRYYLPVSRRLTLALRGMYGYILPYGNQAGPPEDQLFFLGGTTTVRGFEENMLRYDAEKTALGGMEMALGSAEVRMDLGYNIEGSLFYDIGAVRKIDGADTDESFRDSVGLGLRYQTPVGPVGLLYGWKLAPRPDESRGSFHFSMGYTF